MPKTPKLAGTSNYFKQKKAPLIFYIIWGVPIVQKLFAFKPRVGNMPWREYKFMENIRITKNGLPAMTKLLNIWKIFLGQNVLHPKQIIWYIYIFFIRQLFLYFFAPDVPNSHHKDFLDLVFCPFMNFKQLKIAFSDKK